METKIRTTISLRQDLYDRAARRCHDLGFSRLSDLVGAALEDYLERRQVQQKDQAMSQAAATPSYRSLLKRVSSDFKTCDLDGLTDY